MLDHESHFGGHMPQWSAGRWLICKDVKEMEAAAGFEPAHNGFAVRSLNHLGTPPLAGKRLLERETGFEPATPTLARSCSTTELFPRSSEAR